MSATFVDGITFLMLRANAYLSRPNGNWYKKFFAMNAVFSKSVNMSTRLATALNPPNDFLQSLPVDLLNLSNLGTNLAVGPHLVLAVSCRSGSPCIAANGIFGFWIV